MKKILYYLPNVLAALIMVQSLFFKFSGAEESIYIFTTVGLEPAGRYGSGVAELIASVLLFVPGLSWVGAGLALGTMAGAIMSHLTVLGIEVMGDHGQLFAYAILVALCSAYILFRERNKWLAIIGLAPKL